MHLCIRFASVHQRPHVHNLYALPVHRNCAQPVQKHNPNVAFVHDLCIQKAGDAKLLLCHCVGKVVVLKDVLWLQALVVNEARSGK